jgi:hypothetical protein
LPSFTILLRHPSASSLEHWATQRACRIEIWADRRLADFPGLGWISEGANQQVDTSANLVEQRPLTVRGRCFFCAIPPTPKSRAQRRFQVINMTGISLLIFGNDISRADTAHAATAVTISRQEQNRSTRYRSAGLLGPMLGPSERFWICVVFLEKAVNGIFEFLQGSEYASFETVFRELGKEPLER